MGKVIAKKIRGMNLWAKVGLVAALTLIVSVFMYQGVYRPQSLLAAAKTYNLNPGTATSVGLDGSTNILSVTSYSYTTTGTTNQFRAIANNTIPTGTTQGRIRQGAAWTGTAQEIVRVYTAAYGAATTIAASATSHVDVYMRTTGTSASVRADLYEYNDTTGFVGAAKGTATGTITPSVTTTQTINLTLNNPSFSVASGNRLVTVYYFTASASEPVLLFGAATGTQMGYTSFTVDETAGDTTKPTVTAFTVPATSSSLTISGITFTASDNVGVTGYLINESSTPPAAASITSSTAPTSYTAASAGTKTLYAWVKDAAGNVSNAYAGQTCTITLPDTTKPTVTAFTVPATSSSLTISGITFTASDNVGVTGYLINESATPPAAASITSSTAPTSYTAATAGTKTLYAWVKDAAGNVSNAYAGQSCTITLADTTKPTVTAFTVPATSSSLTISGITFTASDNVGVTGYLINESATPPAAASITSSTAPTSYTAGSAGAKTLYAWVKDAAGNVSNAYTGQSCTITLDTTKPTVTAFTVPATSSSLTISGITFIASDNVGVTGYLINESATPPAAASITSSTALTSYTAASAGTKTLYAWVKDAAGNVSNVYTSQTCTVTAPSPLMHNAANVNPTNTKGYGADWGSTFTCATCHAENTSNVKLMATTVATPNGNRNVVFTRMTSTSNALNGVFGNDNRTYAGNGTGGSTNICEVCHRKTTFHRYSTNATDKTHYNNKLCLTCHPHGAGFKGSGHTVPYYATSTGHTGCASGIGCHTNSTPGGTYPTAGTPPDCQACHTKGDPLTANIGCGSCHGAAGGTGEPNGTVHPDAVGSHPKHTALTACTNCHDVGGDVGGNADHGKGNRGNTTTNPAIVNLAASLGWTAPNCTSASCHSSPYGTAPITTPAWGTAAGCGACHTGAPGAFQANGAPNTGGHNIHMTAGAACGDCHTGAVSGTSGGANHADTFVNVANGYNGGNPVTKHTAGSGYSTCTSASCHADPYSTGFVTTNVWSPTSGGCAACHKNAANNNNQGAFITYSAPTTQAGPMTGSHDEHLNYGRYVCADCHAGAVSGTSGGSNHGNQVVNVIQYAAAVTKHAGPTFTYLANGCAAACHITATWGGTLGCIDCHNAVITRKKGRPGTTLAAVKAEFGLAYGHKKTGRVAVSDNDCIVCHLEGRASDQRTSKYHADGNIDLRDPDGVGEVAIKNIAGTAPFIFQRFSTSFAAGSRKTNGQTLDDIANVISLNFCLKCHDRNGASNSTARVTGGTPNMPWGGSTGYAAQTATVTNGVPVANGTINVFSQFSTGNSSVHPVRGPVNNSFPIASRLAVPYNNQAAGRVAAGHTKSLSVVINCFDCHNNYPTLNYLGKTGLLTLRTNAAHGTPGVAASGGMMRGTFYVLNGTLCTQCHTGYTVQGNHASGSAMAWNTGRTDEGFSTACYNCHSSKGTATAPARPQPAADYHGFNKLYNGSNWPTGGLRPYAFIRAWTGTAYHRPYRSSEFTTGSATCGSGTCPANGSVGDGSTRTYTPGGDY